MIVNNWIMLMYSQGYRFVVQWEDQPEWRGGHRPLREHSVDQLVTCLEQKILIRVMFVLKNQFTCKQCLDFGCQWHKKRVLGRKQTFKSELKCLHFISRQTLQFGKDILLLGFLGMAGSPKIGSSIERC